MYHIFLRTVRTNGEIHNTVRIRSERVSKGKEIIIVWNQNSPCFHLVKKKEKNDTGVNKKNSSFICKFMILSREREREKGMKNECFYYRISNLIIPYYLFSLLFKKINSIEHNHHPKFLSDIDVFEL